MHKPRETFMRECAIEVQEHDMDVVDLQHVSLRSRATYEERQLGYN